MSVPDIEVTLSSPKKRSHDGEFVTAAPQTPNALIDDPLASTFNHAARQQSPVLSTTSSSLTDLSLTPSTSQVPSTSTPSAPKAKKRKLTFAERQIKAALEKEEKEAKEKRKAEEKVQKDEEKRKKEEEKEIARRERELDKAEKQKKKDAEKHAKEALKAKKEEQKRKKERSQMRIGAFFGQPPTASTPPSSPDMSSGFSSRRSSIASLDIEMPLLETKATPLKSTDYEKMFPSFFVFENTELAPVNRFLNRQNQALAGSLRYDDFPQVPIDVVKTLPESFRGHRRKRRRLTPAVKEIVDCMHGTSDEPIDLTNERTHFGSAEQLERIPVKVLSFYEDVRPPYEGTYTRRVSLRCAAKLSRNPWYRGLPDTDYEYDSEAEWEPPAPGDDDVNLEEEDSESEADEEEMDDFLDDEDDVGKRGMVVGNMEPVCTGLCWDDGKSQSNRELRKYRIEVLDGANRFPINPYSIEYWTKTTKGTPPKPEIKTEGTTNLMQPPRLPLSAVSAPNAFVQQGFVQASKLNTESTGAENMASPAKQRGRKLDPGKPLKMISSDLLPAFKQAVSGSDLTKAGLIEVLKKKFPKVSKDTIKDSIAAVATREGAKEADKRWTLIS